MSSESKKSAPITSESGELSDADLAKASGGAVAPKNAERNVAKNAERVLLKNAERSRA